MLVAVTFVLPKARSVNFGRNIYLQSQFFAFCIQNVVKNVKVGYQKGLVFKLKFWNGQAHLVILQLL